MLTREQQQQARASSAAVHDENNSSNDDHDGDSGDARAMAVLTAALQARDVVDEAAADDDDDDNTTHTRRASAPQLTHFRMHFATSAPAPSRPCNDKDTTVTNTTTTTTTTATTATTDEVTMAVVLVPVREPLWCVTVADLAAAFVARVSRRFAALTRTCTPARFDVYTPTLSSSSSSSLSSSPCVCVDVCMNGDDTLDSVVAACRSDDSSSSGCAVAVVDVYAHWQAASSASASACTWSTHADALHRVPLAAPHATMPTTYIDVLQRRRDARDGYAAQQATRDSNSNNNNDSNNRRRHSVAAATRGGALPHCICYGGDDDDTDVLLAEGGDAKARARRYAERVALDDAEACARARLRDDAAAAWALLVACEADAARHVLTLEALRGDYTRNGQLAALLRKRRCYPVDTTPLVDAPSPRARRTRAAALQCAATQAQRFAFLAAHPHAHDDEVAAAAARERAAREQRSFRYALRTAVDAARAAAVDNNDSDHNNDVATVCTALPDDVYTPLCDAYVRERRATVRDERVLFRRMTAMMRAVLTRQRDAECAALLHACVASLRVDDVLSPSAYGHTLHTLDTA